MHVSARTRYFIDILILLCLVAAVIVDYTGGFYAEPFGMRVSVRRVERLYFLVLVLAFVRWRWIRSGEFLGRPIDTYRAWWRRTFDPLANETTTPGRWNDTALAAFGLCGIAIALLWNQVRHITSVPDLGDPLFSMWRMGWVFRQIAGDPRPLFDANIFHPVPLTLTLSDSMLLPSLLVAPLFAAGVQPAVIYNIALLALFPVSGVATYLLIRRFTDPSAAFIGALYYMCHPYRFEHYSHFELQVVVWMPLALLAMIRFGETQRLRYAVTAALLAVAQLYSSMYYGVFFPFFAATVFLVLVAARRWPWRKLVRPVIIAGGLACLLAAPLARPYISAQSIKGNREPHAVSFYSAELADFLRPHPNLATHGGHWLEDSHPERALFPGVTPFVLSAAALIPPVGPFRLAFAAGAVLGLDMSVGMNGHLYPKLYDYFPPIRGMRVPARFSVILGISLAVLSAFGAQRVLSRFSAGWPRRLALAGLVALVAIDLRPALDLHPVWPDAPRIYADLNGRTDAVLAEMPFEFHTEWVTNELPFMYFSIWHGHDMVNGYSGFTPDGHAALVELARDFPDGASLAAFRTHGVTHVTVNCAFVGDSCRELMDRMDVRPDLKLIRVAHWQGKPTRLYEIVR